MRHARGDEDEADTAGVGSASAELRRDRCQLRWRIRRGVRRAVAAARWKSAVRAWACAMLRGWLTMSLTRAEREA